MSSIFDRWFELRKNKTTVRTELLAGLTTFLTMAYIIVVQPAMLKEAGMDSGAVMAATCLAAAITTVIMGVYARYPIALAPGMGENAFFTYTVVPAAVTAGVAVAVGQEPAAGQSAAWQVALGVVFYSGVLFLLLSLLPVRTWLFDAVSPAVKNGIAVGIGLFIAFIGLFNADVLIKAPPPAVPVQLNPGLASPDTLVFFVGLMLTAILMARRVPGAILWGIAGATLLAIGLKMSLPYWPQSWAAADVVQSSKLVKQFQLAKAVVSAPPSIAPTFLQMDFVAPLSPKMWPYILIFLFMVLFDTLGTLIGVGEQAGFIKDNKLPRLRQAMLTDAVGTALGACLGTSTVTSYIESAAGVEQGGRTGLVALAVAALFLLAMFFHPIVAMIGTYWPITAPALVVVGSMMVRNATRIPWDDASEAIPAFLAMIGIPLTYSIADGVAIALLSYPIIKICAGKWRDVHWIMYVLAVLLGAYFVVLR